MLDAAWIVALVFGVLSGLLAASWRRGAGRVAELEARAASLDAERARVERMWGRVPAVGAPIRSGRGVHARDEGVSPGCGASIARSGDVVPAGPTVDAGRGLRALGVVGAEASCPVCASAKLAADEVLHGGRLRLVECLHCDHRWTERPARRWAELGAAMGRSELRAVAT